MKMWLMFLITKKEIINYRSVFVVQYTGWSQKMTQS